MTWYYDRDPENNRIRIRFEDDSGTVHGPQDIDWPNAPALRFASDGWVVTPNVKEGAGQACTDLYVDVSPEVGLQALRDLAAGQVEAGVPE